MFENDEEVQNWLVGSGFLGLFQDAALNEIKNKLKAVDSDADAIALCEASLNELADAPLVWRYVMPEVEPVILDEVNTY